MPAWNLRGRRTMLLGAAAIVLCLLAVTIALGRAGGATAGEPIPVAVVAPLTGPQAGPGSTMVKAINLYFDQVNHGGGIHGRPVKALLFDDAGSAAVAKERAPHVVGSPALAAIGHLVSTTSIAAGPIYRDGHLPTVTASGTADSLTADNPYYFRVIFDTSAQGGALAVYVRQILGSARASIIYSGEDFGLSFAPAFTEAFQRDGGTIAHTWLYSQAPGGQGIPLDGIAREVKADPDPGVVLVAVSPNTAARDVVVALRRQGVTAQLMGGSSLGADQFSDLFADLEEERREPGHFVEQMYAVAPLVFDSAGERTQLFVEQYLQMYKEQPDLRAAQYYEAAEVMVEALRNSALQLTPQSRDDDRRRVRDALAAFDSPDRAVHAISGPIYFNQQNTSPDVVRVGRFVKNQFISAAEQLVAVLDTSVIDLQKELAAGTVLPLGDRYVWRQRVVYTGVDFNQITRLDPGRHSFTADFFLWFRYAGPSDITEVEFPSAFDTTFRPAAPQTSRTVDGLNYRLYRVRGEFRNDFDFHDYPFDEQRLLVRLQHPRFSREQVIYVVDTLGLRLQDHRRPPSTATAGLDSWTLRGIRHFQDTLISTSTRGDPAAFESNRETEFSAVNAVARLQRRTLVFLLKSLLPLFLLMLVLYVTLYFPVSLRSERLMIAVSAMLSAAVLLNSINNQLVDAGYTTAIEYVFYMFFGLCLFCTLVAVIDARLHRAERVATAVRFEIVARFVYPLVVLTTVAVYALRFADRFA